MLAPDRLRQKIEDTARIFPWYAELLRDREVRTLTDLPLLTPELLERHYYHSPPDDPALHVYRTSGTSSRKRKQIVYSAEDDQRYLDIKAEVYARFLEGANVQKAFADMGTGHAAGTAAQVFRQIGLEEEGISFQQPIAEHVERLTAFRPQLLYTMPSILDSIVQAAPDPQAFGIRKIILVGEIASREWIQRVAGVFGIRPEDIMDTYGSIELGTIAYFCHELGRYVFVRDMVAEGLRAQEADERLEELGDEERILVLTSLARRMFPALRFVTNDVVRGFRTDTVGGRQVQSFHSIVKRVGPELKHGEKISLYDIEEVVYRHVAEAAIRVQVKDNRLTVYIRSRTLNAEAAANIRAEVQSQIPEIGEMIRCGILEEINVVAVGENEQLLQGPVKNKKLYS
ncbi:hypothetical protein J31TS4_18460 [Paenibacillus sp. J31TS4]|uniref:hypothetical protein n=1 Tax=Paenibacillus sp. J31TS4 TaxID=2807195 RepID=UPI001B0F8A95|nr:hypothetical protein [Paenibacillus sp. J31TS4]GIP38566.1 hypothetical protein J31TS4_18460 [Paenibacillus sp. J31TS4]